MSTYHREKVIRSELIIFAFPRENRSNIFFPTWRAVRARRKKNCFLASSASPLFLPSQLSFTKEERLMLKCEPTFSSSPTIDDSTECKLSPRVDLEISFPTSVEVFLGIVLSYNAHLKLLLFFFRGNRWTIIFNQPAGQQYTVPKARWPRSLIFAHAVFVIRRKKLNLDGLSGRKGRRLAEHRRLARVQSPRGTGDGRNIRRAMARSARGPCE